ncbi:MAG: TVP38/TMEM64 family protein [Candidatus Nanoarchaeia archaeon]
MLEKIKQNINAILGGVVVLALFILVSYILQSYQEEITPYLDSGFFGVLVYVGIGIFATVFAPVSSLPILPVAVSIWGWFGAGVLSVLSWWIGSMIAFLLSRKYGAQFIKRFVSLKQIERYESMIPTKDIFISIILLRIVLPADVLSYALGLFSKIPLGVYALATFIGIIPFAFTMAYIGSLPIEFQIGTIIIGSVLFLLVIKRIVLQITRQEKKKEN